MNWGLTLGVFCAGALASWALWDLLYPFLYVLK